MLAGPNRDRNEEIFLAAGNELDGALTEDLRARVKEELEPGERLLWASLSQPPSTRLSMGFLLLSATTLILLFFGAMAIANSLDHFGSRADDGSAMPLGIFLCTIGCLFLMILIASWNNRRIERRDRRKVGYVVTDRRAVVWVPDSKTDATRVYTVSRGQIRNLVRVERANGSGDLEFYGDREGVDYNWYPFAFKYVPEVRRVEQIVRNNLMSSGHARVSS
jgi:hypothetical protein